MSPLDQKTAKKMIHIMTVREGDKGQPLLSFGSMSFGFGQKDVHGALTYPRYLNAQAKFLIERSQILNLSIKHYGFWLFWLIFLDIFNLLNLCRR